jgi:hypothetical protein
MEQSEPQFMHVRISALGTRLIGQLAASFEPFCSNIALIAVEVVTSNLIA